MKSTYFLAILLVSFALLFPQDIRAQEEAVSASPSAMITPQTVDYSMPYPGILPDNPLYTLKVLRDHVVGFLITEPLKKAEFDLLQSDKRVEAGVYLLKKSSANTDLAFTTMSKGENYFEEAVNKAAEAKNQKMMVGDLSSKLVNSALKHQEIFGDIEKQHVNEKEKYEALRQHSRYLEEKVNTNLLQKKASSS